jgi:hypothetical protein
MGLSMIDTLRGRDFQGRHLLLALRAGDAYRVARAIANEAGYSATGGPPSARRTAELVENATALAARVGHPQAIGITQVAVGITAYAEGRWKTAWELAQRGDRLVALHRRDLGARHHSHLLAPRPLLSRRDRRALRAPSDASSGGQRARRSLRGDQPADPARLRRLARRGQTGSGGERTAGVDRALVDKVLLYAALLRAGGAGGHRSHAGDPASALQVLRKGSWRSIVRGFACSPHEDRVAASLRLQPG